METKFVWVVSGYLGVEIFDSEEKARECWLRHLKAIRDNKVFSDGTQLKVWDFEDCPERHAVHFNIEGERSGIGKFGYCIYYRAEVK